MNRLLATISLLICSHILLAQNSNAVLEGVVTFKASDNVYVRFGDTDLISIGDTLYSNSGGILQPCLQISRKSSSSCICKAINDCVVVKDDKLIYYIRKQETNKPDAVSDPTDIVPADSSLVELISPTTNPIVEDKLINVERIRGRISLASYSNLSSEENSNRHRTMARFSLNAHHIQGSKFSIESYLNYRKNFLPNESSQNIETSFFNIYNLAVSYAVDSTLELSIGRKINRKISSIGPVDGVQAEKHFGSWYTGGLVGFRPDIQAFGFNADLLEYGAYVGHQKRTKQLYTQTTFGVLEQKNAGAIDRRYAYMQHSSTISRDLSLFGSMEMDMVEKPRLTNLYLSARYRFSKKLGVTLSFDSRKRIIYYETLRTEVERLLADDEARKGVRMRVNFRPVKYVNGGVSYSKRFQSDNQNKSDNFNGYLSHSKLPIVGGRISINYNRNKSNFLESRIVSMRHSRSLIERKLQGDFYYRIVNYQYISSEIKSKQYYVGANFSYRLSKKIRLSLLGELSARNDENNYRINTRLSKRL